MNKMQQQAAQPMNTAPSTPLNLVSTEQIQKYLDENKNLIMAILECQKMGKVAECAQYQAILQKNLMYLAAIADAQPQDSTKPSQPNASSVTQQGDSHTMQHQVSSVHQQQQASSVHQQQPPQQQSSGSVPKLPFQLNTLRSPDQQNQLLHFQQQQQLQGHFNLGGSTNNSLHLLMHPGVSNSGNMMDFRGTQPGGSAATSGDGQGKSAFGRVEGRE